jgi:nicotinamidase-related amidase
MEKILLVIDVQEAIIKSHLPKIMQTLDYINHIITLFPKDNVYYIRHIENGTEFDLTSEDSSLAKSLLKVNDQVICKYFNSAFLKTNLDEQLKQRNIQQVYICGFQTEYCIDATIKTGHFLGYQLFVYEQGHYTFDHDLTADQIVKHYNQQFQIYAKLI